MRCLVGVVVAGSVLWASTLGAQQGATLDQYVPAEAPGDGFALSAARVPRHLGFAVQLHVDYANEPLVYEATGGASDSETVALVADQLRAHLGAGLGLLGFLYVYGSLPVDLVLTGTAVGDLPTATGFGAGDLALGVRATFFDRPAGALAIQARITLPTGSDGDDGRPGVAGEGGVTGQPELVGELQFGPVHMLANVGMLFRPDFSIPAARFSDELTYGVGGFVVLPPADRLQAHIELFGSTPLEDVGSGTSTMLELLLGLKVLIGAHWSVGTSGGLGLTRGYGAPDFRWVSLLIWEQPARAQHAVYAPPPDEHDEPEPEPEKPAAPAVVSAAPRATVDADRDGLPDDRDACPDAPGLTEHEGCPQHLRFEPESGTLVLLDPIEFEPERPELRTTSLSVVDELALAIQSDPARVVRIEAHMTTQRRRDPMPLSKARAHVLGVALFARGVPFAQLEAIGCGANRPLQSGLSLRRGGNERVEARLIRPLPRSGMPSSLGCEPVPLPAPVAPAAVEPAPSEPAPMPVASAPTSGSAAALLAALAKAPADDRDGDGTANADDRCPFAPGPAKAAGCPATHDVDLAAGRVALHTPLQFAKGGTRIRSHSTAILPEVAATLRANPEFTLLVLVHAEAASESAQALSRDRANTVRQRLMTEHIDAARLQTRTCNASAAANAAQGDVVDGPVQLWLLDPSPTSGVRSFAGCVASD